MENGCESVAFPLISSGIYGYPKADALRIATTAIQDFLTDHDIDVILVVFDKAAFSVSEKLLGEIRAFIDETYIGDYDDTRNRNQLIQVEKDTLRICGTSVPIEVSVYEAKTMPADVLRI